eukprot:m.311478 g.311478  ORF g.311478 m.311478 type:complete len:1667 (+) comp15956_c0_seq1:541-5541(+)
MALSNAVHIVLGELDFVVSSMRKNARWGAGQTGAHPDDPLLQGFATLKQKLHETPSLQHINATEFLVPFLDVVKSDQTTAAITVAALNALYKFILFDLISLSAVNDEDTMRISKAAHLIGTGVTNTKFISTDLVADEVVLARILSVLRALMLSPFGVYLSNDSVRDVMQCCFRICLEANLSEVLRRQADAALNDMVFHLFSNLERYTDFAETSAFSNPDVTAYDVRSEHPLSATLNSVVVLSADDDTDVDADTDPVVPNDNASRAHAGSDMQELVDDVLVPLQQSAQEGSDETRALAQDKEELSLSTSSPASAATAPTAVAESAPTATATTASSTVPSIPRPTSHPTFSSLQQSAAVQHTNARGVVFKTPSEDVEQVTLAQHGIPALAELLRFLSSLINPKDKQNTEAQLSMGLSMITIAVELSAHHLHEFPSLFEVVEDTLCRALFNLLEVDQVILFASSLRILFLLVEAQRTRFKFHLEKLLRTLMQTDLPSYEHREATLDCILSLCRLPGFVPELLINFDCSMHCDDIVPDLIDFLQSNAYPEAPTLFTINLIALEALLVIAKQMQSGTITKRKSSTGSSSSPTALTANPFDPYDVPFLPPPSAIDELRERKQVVLHGIELFNEKPKKGIAYLEEKGILESPRNPQSIAAFLKNTPQLSKTFVGEFIGAPKNRDILDRYVQHFDFSGKPLDESLRALLTAFRLPGEAQIIERIVESFSAYWCDTAGGCDEVQNPDAAFILSYAIILLNVDQHNPKNKKPMTVEDFLRNQRGLNGTDAEGRVQDFPREYLERIYHNIHSREIVLPEEHEGALREEYLWKSLVQRSKLPGSRMLLVDGSQYDERVFSYLRSPLVTALASIFESEANEAILTRVLDGYAVSCALCSRFGWHDHLDSQIVFLCNATTLQDVPSDRLSQTQLAEIHVQTLASSRKCQSTLLTLFLLIEEHGNSMRESWKNVCLVLRTIIRCGLLPKQLCSLTDFVSEAKTVPFFLPTQRRPVMKAEKSFFSALTGFFVEQRPEHDPLVELREDARQVVALCNVDVLFDDSPVLQMDALKYLVDTLIYFSRSPSEAAAADYTYNEECAVFFVERLTDITLANKDRAIQLWEPIATHFVGIMAHERGQHYLTERVLVALLRLATRFFHRPDLHSHVVNMLTSLARTPLQLTSSTMCQLSAGLRQLVQSAVAPDGEDGTSWQPVLVLLQRCQGDMTAIEEAAAAVAAIVRNGKIVKQNVQDVLTLLLSFVDQLSSLTPPPQLGEDTERSLETSLGSDSVGSVVLEALWALHMQALSAHEFEGELVGTAKAAAVWECCWSRVLKAMARLCLNRYKDVRQHALTTLQRAFLLKDLELVGGEQWGSCLEQIMFPLLDQLLVDSTRYTPADLEELRLRSCNLLSKVVLQHLSELSQIPKWLTLWLRVLDYMHKFILAGHSERLSEEIPESLKNMLLVMTTQNVLTASSSETGELWQLTWAKVSAISPDLYTELVSSQHHQHSVQHQGATIQSAPQRTQPEVQPQQSGTLTPQLAQSLRPSELPVQHAQSEFQVPPQPMTAPTTPPRQTSQDYAQEGVQSSPQVYRSPASSPLSSTPTRGSVMVISPTTSAAPATTASMPAPSAALRVPQGLPQLQIHSILQPDVSPIRSQPPLLDLSRQPIPSLPHFGFDDASDI